MVGKEGFKSVEIEPEGKFYKEQEDKKCKMFLRPFTKEIRLLSIRNPPRTPYPTATRRMGKKRRKTVYPFRAW